MSKDEVGTDAAEAATAGAPFLLPCPFCGSEAWTEGGVFVACRGCDLTMDSDHAPAIEQWNRRTIDAHTMGILTGRWKAWRNYSEMVVEVADRQARSAVAPDPVPAVSKE